MKRFLVFILSISLFISCGVTNVLNNKYYTLEVFQTLANESNFSQCLAKDSNWTVYCIVSAPYAGLTKPKLFYDDLTIRSSFRIVGTYTYKTKNDIYKTVPVLFYEDECKMMDETALSYRISLFCN